MKTSYYYIVNPRSKTCLGKFCSFSQAKKYQILNGLMMDTQIWGFNPTDCKK